MARTRTKAAIVKKPRGRAPGQEAGRGGSDTRLGRAGPDARLGRDEWIAAAAVLMAEQGYDAVAVEPLARRLGVTKGSFYWHFRNLDGLLAACLEAWERANTDSVLKNLGEIADPVDRLRQLFQGAAWHDSAHALYLAISAASHRPEVKAAVGRVSEKRLGFLARTLKEAGIPEPEAGGRAAAVYAAYIGLIHLSADAPGLVRSVTARRQAVDLVFEELVLNRLGSGGA